VKVVESFAAARYTGSGPVGLVPTMGFFHEGHLSLMRSARDACEWVIVSHFVNPLQFGPEEDLAAYPRDLDRDVALATQEGVDVLFVPALGEMYPDVPATRVTVDALTIGLEGRHRPGHFDGVAMAVTKLLAGLRPDRAYFGRKDAQQLAMVRRLAAELSFPTEIVGGSTVRNPDGLALSSRNSYLSEAERASALAMFRGLEAAAALVATGERESRVLEQAVVDAAEVDPGFDLEYAELTDAFDVVHLKRLDREAFLAAAGSVGSTRLIDSVWFQGPELEPDLGLRLDGPSILEGVNA
jgi:pantoate--beta-alanine ligase